jgi:ribosomal protein S12 methylthiotransferase accessory factor
LISKRVGIVTECKLLQKDNREPRIPHVYWARLSSIWSSERPQHETVASGKGMTFEAARASALGEAIETYAATTWDPNDIMHASRSELDGDAIDPRELVLYSDDQYRRLLYSRYSETARLGWIRSRSLVSNRLVYVPTVAVLLDYRVTPEENLFPMSSSGLAAGESLLDAVLRGALEIIERDAFLITWLNRLASIRVDPRSHPDADILAYCRSALRRNISIHLMRLHTDCPAHVFLAIAVQSGGDGPAAAFGLGADLEPVAAARSAIMEADLVRAGLRLQIRRSSQRERLAQLIANPNTVAGSSDHSLLYCSDELIPALDFMLDQEVQDFDWQSPSRMDPVKKLNLLIDHFTASNKEFLYVDLTPRDLASLKLHVARAMIPGYQPIHFGAEACRLAGNRLFELPVTLGLRVAVSTPATLNPFPHPLG